MASEITTDTADDDVTQIFRESSNLGDESNVLLRTLRQLLTEGKPTGLITPILLQLGEQITQPIGALFTGRDLVSFWPAYPKGIDMTKQVDHVTVSMLSGESHCTGFHADGTRYRLHGEGASWRLHEFSGGHIAWWFPLFIRWEVLQQQDLLLQRGFDAKSAANKARIEQAFAQYAAGLKQPIIVKLPETQVVAPNYVLCNVYIAHDLASVSNFTPEMIMTIGGAEHVTGWVHCGQIAANITGATRGQHTFAFAAACPPGELTIPVVVGLPKRAAHSAVLPSKEIKAP